MPEYVYSILLVIILVIIFAIYTNKKKNEQWNGVLEKKKFLPSTEDSSESYTLIFRTEDGKKKRYTTYDIKYWEQWNDGDKAKKNAGEFFPKKV